MKPNLTILLLLLLLSLTACVSLPATPSKATAFVVEATETQILPATENPKPASAFNNKDVSIVLARQ